MMTILLVEDDPFISEIYKKKFESSGFEMVLARDGAAVLKEVAEKSFDLVLLDLVLPEMSGIEILRELKKKGAAFLNPRMKVIVFSNLSSEEDQAEAMKAGADGFLSKTEYTPTELVEVIKKMFPASFSPETSPLVAA